MAGPAFVFIHLHADRCQQSNKFRVYGHKRQPFTCKYDCRAMGGGEGSQDDPQQPENSVAQGQSLCYSRIKLPLPLHWLFRRGKRASSV